MRHALAFLGLTVALAGALALSLVSSEPVATHGYSTLGHNLSTNNRDFRVNNNFSDTSANNNVTPHYNYPGQTGAVMAIWKGHSEWNSRGHGDGQGDPIGNNFIGLFDAGTFGQDRHGYVAPLIIYPTTMPPITVYAQVVTYDPNNLTIPLETTNVVSTRLF